MASGEPIENDNFKANDLQQRGDKKTRSILEILTLPITGTLVAVVLGWFGTIINAEYQAAENERRFGAAQIEGVNKFSLKGYPANSEGNSGDNFDIFAARLVAYGKYSIPIFSSFIQISTAKNDPKRITAERSLIQVAKIYGHSEEVGKTMLVILEDEWKSYLWEAHFSALKVISAIRYLNAKPVLKEYKPEKRMGKAEWDKYAKFKKNFMEALQRARSL